MHCRPPVSVRACGTAQALRADTLRVPPFRIALDEAGRGSWAGPLIVGAVAVPMAHVATPPAGLTDSKRLTPRRRASLIEPIRLWACASATGHATPHEIDSLGIQIASRLAAHRALRRLHLGLSGADHTLLDGTVDYVSGSIPNRSAVRNLPPVKVLAKADLTDPACSAASVLAKVRHDEIILALAARYPQYRWDKGMGYPTAAHAAAVREYGLSNQHRRTWVVQSCRNAVTK